MTGLIPIVILGTLILLFAGRLLVQRTKENRERALTIEDYTSARAALDAVFVETTAIKRIFANEDMEFISQVGAAEVVRFFLKERNGLAIQWLRLTQRQVARLMDLHLRLASYTYEPSPRFEFRLTINYLWFVFISNALLVLLWLRGPFKTATIVSYTLHNAEQFCSVVSMRLEKINPSKLSPAKLPRMV